MLPYGRQSVDDDDIAAVVSVLKSDFLTQGPVVPAFENAVAKKVEAGFGVAANSATSALHVAVQSLGVGPGDRVWTSPITFVASANCARYCGADVDFVDIDPNTFNMSADALEHKLKDAERNSTLPKVIVPVHMCGQSPDMQRIAGLAKTYGIRIVEDASHAIGARYLNEPVGRCRFSDITVFSFHPVKIITSGEGGLAVTNDPSLAEKMSRLRSHGITRDAEKMTRPADGPWYYQQLELGFNYRMTELQAALGISQLEKLDHFVARRHELARRYDERLEALPLVRPHQNEDSFSAFHLYIVRLKTDDADLHRTVFEKLREQGIGVNLHYIPVHLQPYYEALGFRHGDYPEAERYYRQAITLPLFPGMSEQDQDDVIRVLKATCDECGL
ncbi:UDP-4-amino-4,6-dideoxy-N-acetyl-beta-L-altrosamine transaminase [Roseibium sp. MMSF_3412]|uniref:UDP-4-amino-4, 6-dideoxy-N-acetyl-beta-L-altrosamine transaminase n=1 Tax=Roseibium sp. MMSF_3412 TaxID=3046712 RepID=UPI00273FC0CE|nr:UDP-4-amino-4,6-dideoxy-N-acetyl-beta-L-altrosamine transaminase [Roseibium sp. MMSF_3412]